ncbi:MAG: hypothetical protein SNJ31_06885 [Rikenellaceae bacterium]
MTHKNDCQNKKDELQFFYTKAIEGRTILYNNFNYWMNFFAVVVGALFVAYYTVHNNETEVLDFPIIIGCLGFIATSCWLKSLKGFYHWMKSWGHIVRYYENKLNETCESLDETNFVYSLYMDSDCHKNKWDLFTSKNVSTQKIMIKFVSLIMAAWVVMIIADICTTDFCTLNLMSMIIILGTPIVTLVVWLYLFYCKNNKSNVTEHYKLHMENNKYTIS